MASRGTSKGPEVIAVSWPIGEMDLWGELSDESIGLDPVGEINPESPESSLWRFGRFSKGPKSGLWLVVGFTPSELVVSKIRISDISFSSSRFLVFVGS